MVRVKANRQWSIGTSERACAEVRGHVRRCEGVCRGTRACAEVRGHVQRYESVCRGARVCAEVRGHLLDRNDGNAELVHHASEGVLHEALGYGSLLRARSWLAARSGGGMKGARGRALVSVRAGRMQV